MYAHPLQAYNVRKFSTNTFTHLVLWFLILSSAYLYNSVYTQWVYTNQSITNWVLAYKRSQIYNNILFENIYTINNNILLRYSHISNANTFFWFHNNPDTQFFQLTLTENWLHQIIYNHTFMYTFQVIITDISSILTDTILIIVFLLIFFIFFFKIKIVF